MKQNKKIYYTKYFENNWNNIKNTWKGIKTIISIKNITVTVPHSVEFNKKTITDPTDTDTFFSTLTDKNEITLTISFLDPHKSSGPNSIAVKIFKTNKK